MERFDRVAAEWGLQGLRILAVAERELTQDVRSLEKAEESLAAVGIVGLRDPVRPAVPDCGRDGTRRGDRRGHGHRRPPDHG